MAAVFKIDALDLSVHLKVNQGEGLDPYDADGFLEPQWSEGGASDGDPLLSIREGNRQQSFPVILNPGKAGYASTKDGLALLVRDINRVLKNAQVIEWRDDGATRSTYYDAQFVRFDPAWDFRRSQKLWLPGIVRAWTRPYGHTATARIVATTAGSQAVVSLAIASGALDGDADGDGLFTVSVPSGPKGPVFAGVAVAGAVWIPLLPVSAEIFAVLGLATVTGASGALGSQMSRVIVGPSGAAKALGWFLSASLPDRQFRIIGLLRSTAATLAGSAITVQAAKLNMNSYSALASQPLPVLGPTQVLPRGREWRVVDLGTVNGGSNILTSDLLIITTGLQSASGGATAFLDTGGVLLLPETNTIAMMQPSNVFASAAISATVTFDGIGRTALWVDGNPSQITDQRRVEASLRGAYPGMPVGSGVTAFGFAIPDDAAQNGPVSVEVRCREKFTYSR